MNIKKISLLLALDLINRLNKLRIKKVVRLKKQLKAVVKIFFVLKKVGQCSVKLNLLII